MSHMSQTPDAYGSLGPAVKEVKVSFLEFSVDHISQTLASSKSITERPHPTAIKFDPFNLRFCNTSFLKTSSRLADHHPRLLRYVQPSWKEFSMPTSRSQFSTFSNTPRAIQLRPQHCHQHRPISSSSLAVYTITSHPHHTSSILPSFFPAIMTNNGHLCTFSFHRL